MMHGENPELLEPASDKRLNPFRIPRFPQKIKLLIRVRFALPKCYEFSDSENSDNSST
jgi:hypothetical protein